MYSLATNNVGKSYVNHLKQLTWKMLNSMGSHEEKCEKAFNLFFSSENTFLQRSCRRQICVNVHVYLCFLGNDSGIRHGHRPASVR